MGDTSHRIDRVMSSSCMHACLPYDACLQAFHILLVQQAPQRRNRSRGKRYIRLQERLARCVCSGVRGKPQR